MLAEIERLKRQYDLKIADCDKLIEHLRVQITVCRRQGGAEDSIRLRHDRAIEQAKRQCYVQAKYDFDSLIDFI